VPESASRAAEDERELDALLLSVRRATGMDFAGYARSTVRRRLHDVTVRRGCSGLEALRALAVAQPAAMTDVVEALCVSVTAMFRDAEFFVAYRTVGVPTLRAGGAVRAWHPGCATGEEVWSHLIVLEEEGLGDHARLYGTDVSVGALRSAAQGALPLDRMREYTAAYQRSGGAGDFSSYYTAEASRAVVRPRLRRGARFARHDLTADAPFGTFDVVFCRNLLIYFGAGLQERVHARLAASVRPGGILALGRGEALSRTVRDRYEELDARNRIFLRVG
jgi:chemotaxis protein methyltransferase CheR